MNRVTIKNGKIPSLCADCFADDSYARPIAPPRVKGRRQPDAANIVQHSVTNLPTAARSARWFVHEFEGASARSEGTPAMAVLIPSATFLHVPKCGGTWVLRV